MRLFILDVYDAIYHRVMYRVSRRYREGADRLLEDLRLRITPKHVPKDHGHNRREKSDHTLGLVIDGGVSKHLKNEHKCHDCHVERHDETGDIRGRVFLRPEELSE